MWLLLGSSRSRSKPNFCPPDFFFCRTNGLEVGRSPDGLTWELRCKCMPGTSCSRGEGRYTAGTSSLTSCPVVSRRLTRQYYNIITRSLCQGDVSCPVQTIVHAYISHQIQVCQVILRSRKTCSHLVVEKGTSISRAGDAKEPRGKTSQSLSLDRILGSPNTLLRSLVLRLITDPAATWIYNNYLTLGNHLL